jgi:hypothetical protein
MCRLAVLLTLCSLVIPAQAIQLAGPCQGQSDNPLAFGVIYAQDANKESKESGEKDGQDEEEEPDCD